MVNTQKKPTSPCGGCTVCCKVLEVPSIDIIPCPWLHKAESGYSGCSIYSDRPESCQKFECHYIKLQRRPDLTTSAYLRPDYSGVMLVHHAADRRYFVAYVHDPLRPEAWKEPESLKAITQLINEGFRVVLDWLNGGQKILLTKGPFDEIEESPYVEPPAPTLPEPPPIEETPDATT